VRTGSTTELRRGAARAPGWFTFAGPQALLTRHFDDECSTIDVAPAGDVNAGGFDDFIVASSYRRYGETDLGAA